MDGSKVVGDHANRQAFARLLGIGIRGGSRGHLESHGYRFVGSQLATQRSRSGGGSSSAPVLSVERSFNLRLDVGSDAYASSRLSTLAGGIEGFSDHGERVAAFYASRRDKFEAIAKKHLDGIATWVSPVAG